MKRPIIATTTVAICLLFFASSLRAADGFTNAEKDLVKEMMRNLQSTHHMSKLAVDRADAAEVKRFAQQVMGGDEKLIEQLRELCDKNNFKFDEDMTRPDEKRYNQLRDVKGREFDRQYMSAAVHDHQELAKNFKSGIEIARNDDLLKWLKEKDNAVRTWSDSARDIYRDMDDKSSKDRDR